jgi:fumarate hydratase class II
MSLVTEAAVRRMVNTSSAMLRTINPSIGQSMPAAAQRATFSSSITLHKSVTETVTETAKDTLKTVDRTVSDKLVDGIDIGSMFSL